MFINYTLQRLLGDFTNDVKKLKCEIFILSVP